MSLKQWSNLVEDLGIEEPFSKVHIVFNAVSNPTTGNTEFYAGIKSSSSTQAQDQDQDAQDQLDIEV